MTHKHSWCGKSTFENIHPWIITDFRDGPRNPCFESEMGNNRDRLLPKRVSTLVVVLMLKTINGELMVLNVEINGFKASSWHNQWGMAHFSFRKWTYYFVVEDISSMAEPYRWFVFFDGGMAWSWINSNLPKWRLFSHFHQSSVCGLLSKSSLWIHKIHRQNSVFLPSESLELLLLLMMWTLFWEVGSRPWSSLGSSLTSTSAMMSLKSLTHFLGAQCLEWNKNL